MRNAKSGLMALVVPGLLAAGSVQAAATRSAQAVPASSAADNACLPQVDTSGTKFFTGWQKQNCASFCDSSANQPTNAWRRLGSKYYCRKAAAGGGGPGGSSLYILGGVAAAGIGVGVATSSSDSPGS